MAVPGQLGTTSVLSKYFNEGGRKVPLAQFRDELAALSVEEKRQLAELILLLPEDVKKAVGLGGVTSLTPEKVNA